MGLVSRLSGAADDDDDSDPDAALPVAAPEGVAVMTQYHPLAFWYALMTPTVLLDGRPQAVVGWGRIVIPATPGAHHVAVHVPFRGRTGEAEYTATVTAGEFTEIEYSAPLARSAPGAVGPAPQPYHGSRVGVAVTTAVLAAIIVAAVVLTILAMR